MVIIYVEYLVFDTKSPPDQSSSMVSSPIQTIAGKGKFILGYRERHFIYLLYLAQISETHLYIQM